jgi:hypothetical protein
MKYDTMTRKQSAPIWLVVFMMLLLPSCVGDRVFVIFGTVVDENGNPIQDAKITLRDENRHVEATFSTDETGQFFYETVHYYNQPTSAVSIYCKTEGFDSYSTSRELRDTSPAFRIELSKTVSQ